MRLYLYSFILIATLIVVGCSGSVECPLPEPFCGTSFNLNLQDTTDYGPA